MTGFETIEDLVRTVSLVDIRILEDSAKVLPRPEGGDEDVPANNPELNFKTAVWTEARHMKFRFKLDFVFDFAEYVSDIESVYEVAEDAPSVADTPREIIQDFAERIAFMATYPHVRAAVFASAGRLGLTRPLLPLIRPSEIKSGGLLTPEEFDADFGTPTPPDNEA